MELGSVNIGFIPGNELPIAPGVMLKAIVSLLVHFDALPISLSICDLVPMKIPV
ncbi:hypothetical protein D3C85_1937760 [compost metagenome]